MLGEIKDFESPLNLFFNQFTNFCCAVFCFTDKKLI